MLSYNDLESESNVLFDHKGKTVFKIEDHNDGNKNGKHDDLFDFIKKYLVMIIFSVNISIAGILCILVGKTEFAIFWGFILFVCVFPVSALMQFLANMIVALFKRFRKS